MIATMERPKNLLESATGGKCPRCGAWLHPYNSFDTFARAGAGWCDSCMISVSIKGDTLKIVKLEK